MSLFAANIKSITASVFNASDVPVILEPGLSILSTSPAVTGSLTAENTTGI